MSKETVQRRQIVFPIFQGVIHHPLVVKVSNPPFSHFSRYFQISGTPRIMLKYPVFFEFVEFENLSKNEVEAMCLLEWSNFVPSHSSTTFVCLADCLCRWRREIKRSIKNVNSAKWNFKRHIALRDPKGSWLDYSLSICASTFDENQMANFDELYQRVKYQRRNKGRSKGFSLKELPRMFDTSGPRNLNSLSF